MVKACDGGVVTKAQMVAVIQAFARAAGARAGNYTGHSLRVTGAQQMALAGISEDKIRLFGRWTSSAMLAYVRETLLARSGLQVAKAVVTAAAQQTRGTPAPGGAASSNEGKHTAMRRRFLVAAKVK